MKESIFHTRQETNWRIALWLAIVAAALILLVYAVGKVADRSGQEESRLLERNVRRAAVQCYALEGNYPPDIDYLMENYGLTYREDRYAIHYEAFASNILPDITVVLK